MPLGLQKAIHLTPVVTSPCRTSSVTCSYSCNAAILVHITVTRGPLSCHHARKSSCTFSVVVSFFITSIYVKWHYISCNPKHDWPVVDLEGVPWAPFWRAAIENIICANVHQKQSQKVKNQKFSGFRPQTPLACALRTLEWHTGTPLFKNSRSATTDYSANMHKKTGDNTLRKLAARLHQTH